jgi:hypothetical protein
VTIEDLWGGACLDANSIWLNLWSRAEFDGAEIYRSDTIGGEYALIKYEPGKPVYYDAGLAPNTTYYYKVRLVQAGHAGPFAETIAITTNDVIAADIWGGACNDDNSVWINLWSRAEFDGADIYRSDSPGGEMHYVATVYGDPLYIDAGLTPGTVYYYGVRLFQGEYRGRLSDAIAIRTNG